MKSPSPQTRDRQPPGALERQRGADRIARTAADAAAAFRANIVERMTERPGGAVPGQRDVRERDVALADGANLSAAHEIVDRSGPSPARGVGLVGFAAARLRNGLGATPSALMSVRHRLVRRHRQQHVDRRQALVVHAPAVVDAEVVGDGDDLGLRRLIAERALNTPARSTQSSARITSAFTAPPAPSGGSALPAGTPACSGWSVGKRGADLELGDDLGVERLGQRHALVPGFHAARDVRPTG